MNGPGHYIEAERLLDLSEKYAQEGPEYAAAYAARAQAHATLALVAAVANTASIDDEKVQLATVPVRFQKDEDGHFDYVYPWQEALR